MANKLKIQYESMSKSKVADVFFTDRSKIYTEIKKVKIKVKKISSNNQKNSYQISAPFSDDESPQRIAKKLRNLLNRKSNLDKLPS